MRIARLLPALSLIGPLLLSSGCGCGDDDDDAAGVDAGTDAGDGGDGECRDEDGDRRGPGCLLGADCNDEDPAVWSQDGAIRWMPETTGVATGQTRVVELTLDFRACAPRALTLSSSDPAVATVEGSASIAQGDQLLELTVTGAGEGQATITATAEGLTEATLTVVVTSPDLPACSGSGEGRLGAGDRVAVETGTLAGAAVTLPDGATELAATDVDITCAPDIAPDGYLPLGPAVKVAPEGYRVLREVPVELPLETALLPARARIDHVVLAYEGPGVSARIVPFANLTITGSPDASMAYFETPRFGTFQAVARVDANTRTRTRRYTYRAIVGVSMGAGGAALVGFRDPSRWDFIGPLGGPTDWRYLLHSIEQYHLGGFCTAETGVIGEYCPVPAPSQLYEHPQDFEHWYYEDEYSGQGGSFPRNEYVEIFRDLALGFGNPSSQNPDSYVLPAGLPDSERQRSDEERCSDPVVFDPAQGQRYYDDEYNPDGDFPVITFCDGGEAPGDHGTWDPAAAQNLPMEVAVAVDLNGNAIRDPGEPVIKNGSEPYEDTGTDGQPSTAEAGYDAVTNPDPAGDDYDWQFNPDGREGNWDRDEAEPYEDLGIDGVAGTPQTNEGGYDTGEGNGVFDLTDGSRQFRTQNPWLRVREMSDEDFARIDFYSDGGVRDLFNFAVVTNHFVSALVARAPDEVRIYNGFPSLYGDVPTLLPAAEIGTSDDSFDFSRPDYRRIGRHAFVRYGSLDADEDSKRRGDGGHVGTVSQILNRMVASAYVASDRWPGGDRQEWQQDITADDDCSEGYLCTFDFTDERGRTGPVSILLPPGYHDAEFANTSYPVMYFGHGYGQQPQDLVVLAIVFANYMIAGSIPEQRRLQKFIMVFPDGRCREDECINGTFYSNSVRPEGPQMIDFLYDLGDYMDATFRTREPEEIEERY